MQQRIKINLINIEQENERELIHFIPFYLWNKHLNSRRKNTKRNEVYKRIF